MSHAMQSFFAWGTVGWFALLAGSSAWCSDWKQAAIAGLFATSNAVIFLWR